MKKPEVGDTVIIQGIVQNVFYNNCNVQLPSKSGIRIFYFHEITDVIPKPWVPQ
jgi:hypothetical protein